MRKLALGVALAALLTLPATAAATEAALWTEGPLAVRSEGDVEGDVTTMVWNFVGEVETFRLRADRARVTAVDQTVVLTGTGLIIPTGVETVRTWELTDLSIGVSELHAPRFMVWSEPGAATATWRTDGWFEVSPTAPDDPRPFVQDRILFDDEPYLLWRGQEGVGLEGDLMFEPANLTVHLDARENRTSVVTYPRPTGPAAPGGPSLAQRTLLYLDLVGADGDLDFDVEGVASLRRIRSEEARECRMLASGVLAGDRVDRQDLRLAGDFLLDASIDERAAEPAAVALLSGEIEGYGAVEAPVAPAPALSLGAAVPILLVGALLAAVAFHLWARRSAPMRVEQYAQLADAAAEVGDHETALQWTREARTVAPASLRLRQDEAFFLERLGEREAALALYAGLGREGDAESDCRAARLLAEQGGDPAAVLAHLCRALERDPAVGEGILDDPLLARFATMSPLREAMGASWWSSEGARVD